MTIPSPDPVTSPHISLPPLAAAVIYGAIGRRLIKASLSLAEYRSYRDEASRDWLSRIGFPAGGDPVYPDLVFGLPEALLPVSRPASNTARRVVGLGLMNYQGKYSAANPRHATYTAYLEALADFVRWLLDQNYAVRLFLGEAEPSAVDDFREVLRSRCGIGDDERVTEQRNSAVHDVLTEISLADVVVATRFHNVLMSLLLCKPVVAISFHHKCSELMAQMQMSAYCQDIYQIDTGALIEQFQKIEQNRDEVKRVISARVELARVALEEQDDRVFAER